MLQNVTHVVNVDRVSPRPVEVGDILLWFVIFFALVLSLKLQIELSGIHWLRKRSLFKRGGGPQFLECYWGAGHNKFSKWKGVSQSEFVQEEGIPATWSKSACINQYLLFRYLSQPVTSSDIRSNFTGLPLLRKKCT